MGWNPKGEGGPELSGIMIFIENIDWTESWPYGLFVFYVGMFLFLYLTRKYSVIQGFSFILILLTVYMAEDLNEFLAQNHHYFTKHQYFDSSGLFISIFMSTPLLLASSFVVANWFHESTQLMIQVKQLQIDRRSKKTK